MLDFIPIKFRTKEDYIKSFFACKSCKQVNLPPKLYLDICENTLIDNPDLDKPLIYCQFCIKGVNLRCECPIKCEKIESVHIMHAYYFYRIPCYYHNDQDSISFTRKFVQLCSECSNKTSIIEEIISLTYSSLSNTFFQLYHANYRQFSNDRRQKMVTYSCQEMLNACRWMYQIENGILCDEHPNERAEFINNELKLLCRFCNLRNLICCPLSDISQASHFILEKTKSCENHKNPFLLNKYMTDMLKLNKHYSITTPSQLNLLILECRDLLNKIKYITARCVSCNKKLIEGRNQRIILICEHSVCFNCYSSKWYTNCPIDNQELKYKTSLNIFHERLMLCHAEHLFKPGENVFKLQCFHSSCENHYTIGYCFQCGFEFDKWPNKNKQNSKFRTKFQSYYDLRCAMHNKKAQVIKMIPLTFYCKNCEYNTNENLIKIDTIKHLITKFIFDEKNNSGSHTAFSASKLNLNSKGLYSFSLAKSLQTIKNIDLERIQSNSILFFKEECDFNIYNQKNYYSGNKTTVIINFKINSDIFLTGIIMSKLVFPIILPFQLVQWSPTSVKINYYHNKCNDILETIEITYFTSCPNKPESLEIELLREKLSIFNFSKNIFLPSSEMNYELIVEIQPGYYLFSNPTSKLKFPLFEHLKINRKTNISRVFLDGSISSPVFGVCAANLESI